jgi:PKHD-type hydroxylase
MAPNYLEIADAFTASECDSIVALAPPSTMIPAPVYAAGDPLVDPRTRDVLLCLRRRDTETDWLYDRIDALFAAAAPAFEVEVAPMAERLQILRYEAGGHFQAWHSDAGIDRQETRLLSISVELSEPADHEGGLLEIPPDRMARPRSLKRGGACIFPSRALHRVSPVTRGTRWALVNWTGPA